MKLEILLSGLLVAINLLIALAAVFTVRKTVWEIRHYTHALVVPLKSETTRRVEVLNAGKGSALDIEVLAQDGRQVLEGTLAALPPDSTAWIQLRHAGESGSDSLGTYTLNI